MSLSFCLPTPLAISHELRSQHVVKPITLSGASIPYSALLLAYIEDVNADHEDPRTQVT
jgi:hypothetical protein